MECIRKTVQTITTVAVDIKEYKKAPTNIHKLWGSDPVFLAFTRAIMEISHMVSPGDNLSVVCDDEEKTAWPMYRLYRQVKRVYPEAKDKLSSLSFADDDVFYALQAADFVSSLARLEARQKFNGEDYEYVALWNGFTTSKENDRVWDFSGVFMDREMISNISKGEAERRKSGSGLQGV